MSPAQHVASLVLVVTGTVVMVASSLAGLMQRDDFARLHYVTPLTSLGGPLLAVGLAVADGPNLTTASVLLPVALLFFSGPLLSAAIARTLAQRAGLVDAGSGPG